MERKYTYTPLAALKLKNLFLDILSQEIWPKYNYFN